MEPTFKRIEGLLGLLHGVFGAKLMCKTALALAITLSLERPSIEFRSTVQKNQFSPET